MSAAAAAKALLAMRLLLRLLYIVLSFPMVFH